MSGSLVELVDRRAADTPDLILLVDEQGSRMTCSGFASETVRVAERLATAGIGEGVLVSSVLPTAIETFVVMVALARLGAVQNPVNPMYREREIGHILDEAAVDAMIVVPERRGIAFLSMCTSLASSRGDLPVLSFPAGPSSTGRACAPWRGLSRSISSRRCHGPLREDRQGATASVVFRLTRSSTGSIPVIRGGRIE
jgi:acyl-CoA synthetase (AMP-forming)/AMP-acid ligase II